MSIVAGMDLGYGSQVKVVTSNYLIVNVGSNPTDAGAVNFLQLANDALATGTTNTDGRQKAFQFDYIMCDTNAPTITSPSVIDATGTTTVPLHGPGAAVLGGGSSEAHSTDATAIGRSANGIILAILAASAGTVLTNETATLSTLDTAAVVNMAGLTDDASVLSHLQGELLQAQITGTSLSTLDVTDVLTEVAAESLTSIDLSVAGVNADFVAKGNAAGTTPTTLGTVTADGNKLGVMSITALVRTAV